MQDTTTILEAADLRATFGPGSGKSFLETPEYRVGTARRDGPGEVEIHTIDTDIFYVVEGSATLVTGGQTQNERTVGPNEIRGTTIVGGNSRTVGPGDIIVIPKGVPHWFNEVPEPFIYLVVKSTSR